MTTGRSQILALYKKLLRESQKFSAYNYREYALRRIKDGFKENKDIKDLNKLKQQYEIALDSLEIIKRQVVIGKLYDSPPLVIENIKK